MRTGVPPPEVASTPLKRRRAPEHHVADGDIARIATPIGQQHAPVLVVSHGCELDFADDAHGQGAIASAIRHAARATHATVVQSTSAPLSAPEAAEAAGPGVVIRPAPAPGVPGGLAESDMAIGETERDAEAITKVVKLAGIVAGSEKPIAMLIVGGGEPAMAQAVAAANRGWPLLVVAGTGGTAEEIATARKRGSGTTSDVGLGRALGHADITVVDVERSRELVARLTWALSDDVVLQDVWRLFATYDRAATRLQGEFLRYERGILLVGVLATLLALLHQDIGTNALRWAVVAAPIIVSSLIALSGRRATGKRWVVLRGAAECVKSEIYRYRTRTGAYADDHLADRKRSAKEALADQIGKLQERLTHTEAGGGELVPYDGPLPPDICGASGTDDGLSALDARGYLRHRVDSELRYYERRVRELDRLRRALQFIAICVTAVGALVAAARAETWVALTTALGAAALAYLGHLQVDATIVSYNHTAARLENLKRKWHAHALANRADGLDKLVKSSEAALTTELGGWVAHMSEALREEEQQEHQHGGS